MLSSLSSTNRSGFSGPCAFHRNKSGAELEKTWLHPSIGHTAPGPGAQTRNSISLAANNWKRGLEAGCFIKEKHPSHGTRVPRVPTVNLGHFAVSPFFGWLGLGFPSVLWLTAAHPCGRTTVIHQPPEIRVAPGNKGSIGGSLWVRTLSALPY
eukprot:514312-Rhodomonas_salina.1